ncbi:RecBCD enzyme subunit RecC, partial [Haemophilus influenzae]
LEIYRTFSPHFPCCMKPRNKHIPSKNGKKF